jgi:FdhD protein
LAVGFLFAEDMIASTKDIVQLTQRTDPHVIAIRVNDSERITGERNLIVTSSCGMCGSRKIVSLLEGLRHARDTLRVSPIVLRIVAQQMRDRQDLFARTGGTHAAAIFSADGKIVAMGEDIGRHNALDKAVGKCLLKDRSLCGCGVMLSSRISLEMLAKSAQAGLEIVAGLSAPTSLAIEVAERCGITLCGFVRDDRATVYTHPHRLQGLGHHRPRLTERFREAREALSEMFHRRRRCGESYSGLTQATQRAAGGVFRTPARPTT